jgi:outer membrane biosynthesis protein TonB
MQITSKDFRKLTVWPSLLILSLLTAPALAFGQTTAEDYFHEGAQYYVFGDKADAAKAIYTGLRAFPTDQKLNAVAKLLLRKEPEDKNKSKSSQQNQKQNQEQKQQQNGQDKKSAQDEKKEEEKKRQQEQAKKDQEKKEQEAQAKEGEQKEQQQQEAQQAAAAGQMTPEEARQLLSEQKDEEKSLIFSPENQPVKTQPGKVIKDW